MADAAAGGFFLALLIFIWSCLPCIICFGVFGGAIGLVAYCINKSNREERENAMRLQQMVIQKSNSNVNV
uniref:Candidate secreted effector n=1 Tax=Meloidogyne incognita TaxID=6306 RepID=A0A914LCS9_MELIC